jgi:hypothetical protein
VPGERSERAGFRTKTDLIVGVLEQEEQTLIKVLSALLATHELELNNERLDQRWM